MKKIVQKIVNNWWKDREKVFMAVKFLKPFNDILRKTIGFKQLLKKQIHEFCAEKLSIYNLLILSFSYFPHRTINTTTIF